MIGNDKRRRPPQLPGARGPVFNPAWIGWVCGLVPLVAVHCCYILSASQGIVDWCLPYIDGCTSISRAGRHGIANHVFKASMLPTAGLMLVFWVLASDWLDHGSERSGRRRLMGFLGVVGALFLILYATFLGVQGETYQWLRRYGVTVYFSFTVLAQLLMASLVTSRWLQKSLTGLGLTMLLLGLASIPLQHLMEDRDALLNAIEWNYALLMTLGFVVVGSHWHRHGFRLQKVWG